MVKMNYTEDVEISENGYLTQDEMDEVVSSIERNDNINSDIVSKMDVAQIELALMVAGFTGAVSDDLENGTVYIPAEKEDLIREFQDELVNEMEGYGLPDSFWTVLYKDGTRKFLDEEQNDYEDFGFTKTACKQNYNRARAALHLRDVAAIIRSDGYDQPRYFVNKGGEQQMRDYGFEFWQDGRGEKQRDYIQDDWI